MKPPSKKTTKLEAVAIAAAVVAAAALSATSTGMSEGGVGWEPPYGTIPETNAAALPFYQLHAPMLGNGPAGVHHQLRGELPISSSTGDVYFDTACNAQTPACNMPFFESTSISLAGKHRTVDQSGLSVWSSAYEEESAVPHPTGAWIFGFVILIAALLSTRMRFG